MKLHINWRRAIAWSFVVLTAASAVNLVLEARAYFLFYSALDEVQFKVQAVSLRQLSTNTSRIVIQIIGTNPVDYSGLKVTLIIGTTYFASLNYTLFYNSPLQGNLQIYQTLPANGSTSWNMTIPVNSQANTALGTFYEAHRPNITAGVSLVVEMSTFLDKVLGLPTQLPPIQQNVTLT
jgi:hypothetical protein